MDGIYYNQEVTAEMLNGIAQDLGHTSFNGYGTDKFGADELNKITGELVSAGVLLIGNKCRVINSDGIYVQDGTIVFSNGAKKTITEALPVDADNDTVIYALNDTAAGICTIEVAEAYPTATDADYVPLASVGSDGVITDDRVIARAKMELTAGNSETMYTFSGEYGFDFVRIAAIDYAVWDLYNNFVFRTPTSTTYYSAFLRKDEIEYDTAYSIPGTILKIKFVATDDGVEIYFRGTNASSDYASRSGEIILI